MVKKLVMTALVLFVLQDTHAQNSLIIKKWKFQSFNQAGLLNGEQGTAFHLQSVNGFQYKNLFTGIGLGLDYYRYRSIPLFAELKYYFGETRNRFFLYADGGTHFVWQGDKVGGNTTATYYPRFYSNTGLGYQAGLKNGMALLVNAGYSYKKVKYKDSYTICPFIGSCYIQEDIFKYNLNRLIVQVGWMF